MKKRIILAGLLLVLILFITGCENTAEFTISFESNGGTSCTAIKTNGSPKTMPKNPTKENFEFDGWYWDNDVWKEPFTFNSILDKPVNDTMNLTVYAKWQAKNKYTISFDSDGGSSVEPITQDYFSNVYAPTAPQRLGYDFVNWELDGTEYIFSTMPLGDITLKAIWTPVTYKIAFVNILNGNNPNTVEEYTIETETINFAIPTREHYSGAWNVENIPQGSTGNKTISAVWTPITYTIVYKNLLDGSTNNVTEYNIESETIFLTEPYRAGYRGTWDITSIPKGTTGTVTVTAIWTKQYTITFETFDGSQISKIIADDGSLIQAPAETIKDGFRFLGWYKDFELTQPVSFPFELTKNETIYAKWIALYTVSFNSNGGTYIPESTFDDGTLIQAPDNPFKPGLYNFAGWYYDVELTEAVAFPFALNKDTVLYAKHVGMKIISVAAGDDYELYLDIDGGLWARGYNGWGRLGDGTEVSTEVPIRIKPDTKFKSIAVGIYSGYAIDENGGLWAWGYNASGNLGNGTESFANPTPILVSKTIKFKTVSADSHVLAIDENGQLWAWGDNGNGQLGNGLTENISTPIQIMYGTKFIQASAGGSHSLAIDENGKLWSWGYNRQNAVPMGELTPKQVMSEKTFKAVQATDRNNFAIDETGKLWAWGWNSGYLGDGTGTAKTEPVWLRQDVKFVSISASDRHCIALDESGNIWVWGANSYKQLGDETTVSKAAPICVLQDKSFVYASAGGNRSLGIDESGGIWFWGDIGFSGIGTKVVSVPIKLN